MLQSVISHVLPSKEVKPRRPVRRTASMTHKDVVLANAATAIREQAADEKAEEAVNAGAKPAERHPAPAR